MLTKTKIMDAVAAALHDEWPDRDIHTNLVPADFERPAFLLEAPRISRRAINHSLIEETIYLTVTCFAAVGDYGHSDTQTLAQIQERVLELFRTGVLPVENRVVRLTASEGGMDFDRAWIDLQTFYHEARDANPPVYPIMGDVAFHTTAKED